MSITVISVLCLAISVLYAEFNSTGTTEPRLKPIEMEKGYLPVTNYSPVEYAAMPQNWSVVQDHRGLMYIANNEGILEYDGKKWRKILMPEEQTVRSLSIDDDGIIYVGSQGDFGYLTPDSTGELIYFSLLKYLTKKDQDFFDVWTNYVTADGIYFQTLDKIFLWTGDTIKVWNSKSGPDVRFHKMFYVDSTIYVQQDGVGLMKIVDDQMVLIQGGELFKEQKVYFMIEYDNDHVLLSTRLHGLYLMKPTDRYYFPKDRNSPTQLNEIKLFHTQIDEFFLKNFVYNGLKLSSNRFAIGTQGGGVIIIDKAGRLVQILNKNSGLSGGTVSNQYLDNNGNLWLALGNGISKVEINSPLSAFDDKTGLEGTVQAITRHNGVLYAATLLGVYYLPNLTENAQKEQLNVSNLSQYEHSDFKEVSGIKDQCWSLLSCKIDGVSHLLVACNAGIFWIDAQHNAHFITRYDPWCIYQYRADPNRIFIGCTDGLASLYYKNGKWIDAGKVEGHDGDVITMMEDNDDNIWLSPGEGVLKMNILSTKATGEIDEASFAHYDTSNGLGSGQFYINRAMNRILYAGLDGLYKFDGTGFVNDEVFGDDFAFGEYDVHRIAQQQNGNVWMETISSQGELGLGYAKSNADNSYSWVSKPFRSLSEEIIMAIYHDRDDITWLGGPGGIYRYDGNVHKDYERDFPAMVRKVILGEDSVLFGGAYFDKNQRVSMDQPVRLTPVLAYEFNSLTFVYSAPNFDNESAIRYSHYLEGFDKDWHVWKEEAKANYTNLPEGKYKFRVKAINVYQHESTEGVYSFTILPPWHRTIWAYIAYVLSFIGFVYGAITVSTRGLQKIIRQKTADIVLQKEEIEEKNKDITDSINYAQKIQEAILPSDNEIQRHLPESFVLFKPKDIVSGDFYWFTERDGKALIIAADCTGHGVPGAFMSMIGNSLLNEIVNEQGITEPAKVLQQLKLAVIKSLKQTGEAGTQKDGMDIALCAFEIDNMKVEFSGAYNPLFLIRDNELQETRSDRMPIGVYSDDGGKVFTNHSLEMMKGDVYYIFTDGFVDQFGGPKGKKYMGKKFKQLMLDIHKKPMAEQKTILDETIEDWKAYVPLDGLGSSYEQMDDILVIGIRV